jgi:DNA ligase (NAD+)
VLVAGSTVTFATLHNQDQARLKDVRPGDMVIVRKAGDVIPEVVGPVLSARPEDVEAAGPWQFPTTCPFCGEPLQRLEGEADTYCVNVDCPNRILETLDHFASRKAMDIEGLGYETAKALLEAGLVSDLADLYLLDRDAVFALEGFGDKKTDLLLDGIQKSRTQPIERLLTGLNIRHIGPNVAKLIARSLGDLQAMRDADVERIAAIDGVGTVIADSLVTWMGNDRNAALLDKLVAAGVRTDTEVTATTSDVLAGRTLVITGTLAGYSRDEGSQGRGPRRADPRRGRVRAAAGHRRAALIPGAVTGRWCRGRRPARRCPGGRRTTRSWWHAARPPQRPAVSGPASVGRRPRRSRWRGCRPAARPAARRGSVRRRGSRAVASAGRGRRRRARSPRS